VKKPELDIQEFTALTERERLDSLRHPTIRTIRQERLTEIFPHEGPYKPSGMRGQERKKTSTPIDDDYREKRRNRIGRKNKERIEVRARNQKLLKERNIK
jgi:hypothetical protein